MKTKATVALEANKLAFEVHQRDRTLELKPLTKTYRVLSYDEVSRRLQARSK